MSTGHRLKTSDACSPPNVNALASTRIQGSGNKISADSIVALTVATENTVRIAFIDVVRRDAEPGRNALEKPGVAMTSWKRCGDTEIQREQTSLMSSFDRYAGSSRRCRVGV